MEHETEIVVWKNDDTMEQLLTRGDKHVELQIRSDLTPDAFERLCRLLVCPGCKVNGVKSSWECPLFVEFDPLVIGLHGSRLTLRWAEALVRSMQHIPRLHLSSIMVGSDAFALLCVGLRDRKCKLRSLKLDNLITNDNDDCLRVSEWVLLTSSIALNPTQLEDLSVGDIKDCEMKLLADVLPTTNIRRLTVRARLDDNQLVHLVRALPVCPTLIDLDLARNNIKDINGLAEALPRSALQRLVLRDNQIENVTKLTEAMQSPDCRLTSLDIIANPFDFSEIVKALEHPNCRIMQLAMFEKDWKAWIPATLDRIRARNAQRIVRTLQELKAPLPRDILGEIAQFLRDDPQLGFHQDPAPHKRKNSDCKRQESPKRVATFH